MITNSTKMQASQSYKDNTNWQQAKKLLLSPKRKYFKMNFYDNSLSPDIHEDSIEQQKMRQYLQEFEKDQMRYLNFKDTMKKRYFNIRTTRQHKINPPSKLKPNHNTYRSSHDPFVSNCFITDQRLNKSKEDLNSEFGRLLILSESAMGGDKRKKKVRTRSELNKKNKEIIENEKKMIIKLIKKSQSVDMNQGRKWEDLTAKEKYMMNFSHYLKKKTQSEIDKDIYEKKIKKKTKPLEQFQDFILEEVKFTNQHRQKLDHFFKGIRSQFKRVETHRG